MNTAGPWKMDYVPMRAVYETAYNPTPTATGCVETAATVPSCDGTGETDKALWVGPVQDKCEVCGSPRHKEAWRGFTCYSGDNVEVCGWAEHLAITRAKQLAEAEGLLVAFADGGDEEAKAAVCDYFYAKRNKPKEPTE